MSSPVLECKTLTLDGAKQIAEAAIAHARTTGLNINVAVVDRSGTLMTFLRRELAPLHSIDIAMDKAYTAASFGIETGDWAERLARLSDAHRISILNRPRFAGIGGGLPVFLEGQLVGAIGVSGATAEEDIACANAGLASLAGQETVASQTGIGARRP